jgi:predicted nucleotidyltransferase
MALVQSKRDAIHAAATRNRARSIAVFGSVARGEDTESSDIDFLVQFTSGASLMDLVRLQLELEALLGSRVDVVSVGGLKGSDEHIRREAVAV